MARRRKKDPLDTSGNGLTRTRWVRHEPVAEGVWWVFIWVGHVFNDERWNTLMAPAVVDDFGNLVVVGRFA